MFKLEEKSEGVIKTKSPYLLLNFQRLSVDKDSSRCKPITKIASSEDLSQQEEPWLVK